MPTVKPLSDFTRNQTAMLQELHDTGEPIYLTRNGSAAVVVMDAEAFDEFASSRKELRAREMRVYDGIMRGYEQFQNGEFMSAQDAETKILEAKDWA